MNVSYVPNSMRIMQAPGIINQKIQTDAYGDDFAYVDNSTGKTYIKFLLGNNASFSEGGILDSGAYYQVQFNVRTISGAETVRNTGMIICNTGVGDLLKAESSVVIGSAGAAPLAVKLISFTAVLKNNSGILNWVTENELTNDYFDVQRSEDGINFYKKGSVKGNGTTAVSHYYQFIDDLKTNASVIYYRLKIVDLNGRFSYSKIVAIQLSKGEKYSVYPNPFVDKINISLNMPENGNVQYRILSIDGKMIVSRKVFLQKGINIIVANDLNIITAGNYFLEIHTVDEKNIKTMVKR